MLRNRRRRQLLEQWRRQGYSTWDPATALGMELPRRRSRRYAPSLRLRPVTLSLPSQPSRRFTLLAAIATAGLALTLLVAEPFRIRGAAVSGCTRVAAADVYQASGLDGVSILRADSLAAARRITSLREVQSAQVDLALPSRVWIRIEEWQPILLWSNQYGTFGIDPLGRALAAPPEGHQLVRVDDESGILTSQDGQLDADLLDAALAFGSRYRHLLYRRDVGFVVALAEGWQAWLGNTAAESGRRLAMLDAVRQQLAGRQGEIDYVDLRFLERPYFRLRADRDDG